MIRFRHAHNTQIYLQRILVITILLIAYFGHIPPLATSRNFIAVQNTSLCRMENQCVQQTDTRILRDKRLCHLVFIRNVVKMNRWVHI